MSKKQMTALELARMGGNARAASMTASDRAAVARRAAKARWRKRRDAEKQQENEAVKDCACRQASAD